MNLIIDGNAFMNVAANIVKSKLADDRSDYYVHNIVDDRYELKDYTKLVFRDFSANYMSSLITPLRGHLNEVFLVFDSKSWRKGAMQDFFAPSREDDSLIPEKVDYKEGRRYDDYQYLFYEYFQQEIVPFFEKHINLKVMHAPGAEGDDCVAILTHRLKGDITIWSVDQDFKQLVETTDDRFVILTVPKQMYRHKRLFTTIPVKNDIEEKQKKANESSIDDLFELDDEVFTEDTRDAILGILAQKQFFQYEIDPVDELLNKILGGDKKDAVPRLHNMTKSKVTKTIDSIFEKYNKDDLLDKIDSLDEEFIEFVLDCVVEYTKLENKIDQELRSKFKKSEREPEVKKVLKNVREDLREHLIFNIKVIRLSPNVIPDDLVNELDRQYANLMDRPGFKYTKLSDIKEDMIQNMN